MDPALTSLFVASVAFVGGHFVLSHPLRAPLVSRMGERAFLGLYSLYSLATFAWMVLAFNAVPSSGGRAWAGYDEVTWTLTSLLTLAALVLLLGSFRGNPAMPQTGAYSLSRARPEGVFAVTRHPMMWSFALAALSHILVMPTRRVLILWGAILILALVGAALQDRKKEALLGEAWARWQSVTTFWPRWRALPRAGGLLWLIAFAAWLAITWAHIPLAAVPAGVWRWAG